MTSYTYLEVEQEEVKRPFGIYAIIGLLILDIFANFFDTYRVWQGLDTFAMIELNDPRLMTILNIGITILIVIVIIGLWRYQKWAWFAVMIMAGIALVVGIWHYFQGGEPYLNLLFNSLVVFYLNQRNVRAIFEDLPGPGTTKELIA